MYRKWNWTLLCIYWHCGTSIPNSRNCVTVGVAHPRLTLQRSTEWEGNPLYLCKLNNSYLRQLKTFMHTASMGSLGCNPNSWCSTAPCRLQLLRSSTGRHSNEMLPLRGSWGIKHLWSEGECVCVCCVCGVCVCVLCNVHTEPQCNQCQQQVSAPAPLMLLSGDSGGGTMSKKIKCFLLN